MWSRTALRRSLLHVSAVLLVGLAAAWPLAASAAPKTVCTVTINSSDEKEAFQRHLPRDQYQFVELVQRGKPDWLESARRRGVSCDVLIISGHFDDGTEFYTDRFDDREFLTVHEMQHASCSASGDGLFSQLKEVYLFGCNTLKSDPRYVASAEVVRSLVRAGHSQADAQRASALLSERYGQSNRDRLRHVFKDVPVLYGFSSKAPLGRTAGPLLERYFQTAPKGEVASGRPSPTLLKLFGPSSMIAVAGLTDADPHAGFRRDMCGFADDRPSDAQKLAFMHEVLQRDVTEVRMFLDHLERYAASLGAAQRRQPEVAAALGAIERDRPRARTLPRLCARRRRRGGAHPHDGAGAQPRLAVARAGAGGVPAHDRRSHGPRQPGQERGRSRLHHPSARPGPRAATGGDGRRAPRQRGALGRAGVPGQHRGPRTHRARADEFARRGCRDRAGLPAPPAAGRCGRAARRRVGHRAHDGRRRPGARPRRRWRGSAWPIRRACRRSRGCFRWPARSKCSARSPAS